MLKTNKGIAAVVVTVLCAVGLVLARPNVSFASSTIVVNSKLDTNADDGVCTLREAILAANSDTTSGVSPGECAAGSGADTINFAITGAPDFVVTDRNGVSQNGYTIAVQSGLPANLGEVTIDGYSQPGALPNSTVWPRPFDGTLLIELNGEAANGRSIELDADNSSVSGLVINRFVSAALLLGADNIHVYGNYIGTDPTGLIARPNGMNGINGGTDGFSDADDALIGGTNPAHRNIISANTGSGITPNVGQDGWVVKGNYIGMAADGLTPMGNSEPNFGPGGMSIDNCADTVVGGSEPGAGNLISGNYNDGLIPDNVTNLVIQGNMIGPNWKGEPIPSSPQPGGIGLYTISGPIDGALIGGTTPGAGNIITGNKGPGIIVPRIYFPSLSEAHNATNVAILGNSIYGNELSDVFRLGRSGLGIDHFSFTIDESFMPADILGVGMSVNDPGDGDVGGNDFLNHPELRTFSRAGNVGSVLLDLDVAGATSGKYRVEFFASDTATAGQGQTYLGASVLTAGGNLRANFDITDGAVTDGKYITATATQIHSVNGSEVYGSTSEFSDPIQPALLASSGQNIVVLIVAAISLTCTSLYITKPKHAKPL